MPGSKFAKYRLMYQCALGLWAASVERSFSSCRSCLSNPFFGFFFVSSCLGDNYREDLQVLDPIVKSVVVRKRQSRRFWSAKHIYNIQSSTCNKHGPPSPSRRDAARGRAVPKSRKGRNCMEVLACEINELSGPPDRIRQVVKLVVYNGSFIFFTESTAP